MKRKHLITSLFVSLATTFGVLAGTLTHKEDKAVKAATGDDTLILVSFDASSIDSSWRNQCSNFRVHLWYGGSNTTLDRYYAMYELGVDDIYMTTVAIPGSSIPAGYQIVFDQGSATKYSTNMSGSDFTPWSHGGKHYRFSLSGSWSGDDWIANKECTDNKITFTSPSGTSQFLWNQAQYDYFNVRDINAVTDADYSIDLQFGASFDSTHDYVYSLFFSKEYVVAGSAPNTFRFKEAGNYYLFINNFVKTTIIDGSIASGIFELKKESFGPDRFDYVYYVSENQSEEDDINIYTFEAAIGTGDYPGVPISYFGLDIVDCVFGFKFQNKQSYCKVYRIKYDLGYVGGIDHFVQFNYPNGGGQTEDMLLINRAAYWRNTAYHTCNYEAGAALEVIYDLQSVLEEVSAYTYQELSLQNSVCAISQSEAARLYRSYIALPSSVRQTYIDASYVNTYNSEDATGKNYISAYDIFTLLGRRGGVIGNSRINLLAELSASDASTIAAIVVVAIVSTASVGAFFTLKKRKHN